MQRQRRRRGGGGGEGGAVNSDWARHKERTSDLTGYLENITYFVINNIPVCCEINVKEENSLVTVEIIQAWRAEIPVDDDQWPGTTQIPVRQCNPSPLTFSSHSRVVSSNGCRLQ